MPKSLFEAFRKNIVHDPDRDALIFVGPAHSTRISYRQLDQDAQRWAVQLQVAGVQSGDLVILAFGHDYELVAAFWGAIYAGAVPTIFLYPEAIPDVEHRRDRLQTLIEFTNAHAVLCANASLEQMAEWLSGSPTIPLSLADAGQELDRWILPKRGGEDLAYIQFSSGTTGQPKGIMLSHRAVLNNVRSMTEHWRFTTEDVCVNWLPFYHDMGLLIQIILPLLNNACSVTISPTYWVRRPQVLFRTLNDYRGTVTWMPNFAFHHCLRMIRDDDLTGLNLTSWRILGNGSELVQADTLHRFVAHFSPCGFSPTALIAGYGMAENVVAVASTLPEVQPGVDHVAVTAMQEEGRALPLAADQPGTKPIVSCGTAMPSIVVSVVDETGRPLPERKVGEVVVGGDSLFSGYFNDPVHTAQALRDGWFYTGDLGYLAGGELHICDRKQDLIIVGGRNIFPESIEATARETLDGQVRHVVAFGVADLTLGTEAPVLVCEGRPGLTEDAQAVLAEQVRRRVGQTLSVTLADIHFAPRGWIVRTTSGKLARVACRDKYLAEGRTPESPNLALLRTAGDDPALLEQALTSLFVEMLGAARVSRDDNFFDLGGDSLTALRMLLSVEEATGQPVPPEFFNDPTVAHLAKLLMTSSEDSKTPGHLSDSLPLGQPARRQAPSFREKLRNQIVKKGPIWHEHRLPYSVGVRLQRFLVAQPFVQRRFARQLEPVKQWSQELGVKNTQDKIIAINLLANTWAAWHRNEMMKLGIPNRWFRIIDQHIGLLEHSSSTQGIVLAIPHAGRIGWELLESIGQKGYETGFVRGGQTTSTQNRSKILWNAQQVLRRGGIVLLGADGRQGEQAIDVPFWGRRRPFQIGAAELAVTTGSLFVPVYVHFDVQGQVVVEISAPLVPETTKPQAQIRELTERYGADYATRWPQFFASVRWGYLTYNLSLPSY